MLFSSIKIPLYELVHHSGYTDISANHVHDFMKILFAVLEDVQETSMINMSTDWYSYELYCVFDTGF